MTEEPRRRSSCPVWIAAALVLLPVLYVAGIGPMVGGFQRGIVPLRAHQAYMSPFWSVQDDLPEWAKNWLDDYAEIFIHDGP